MIFSSYPLLFPDLKLWYGITVTSYLPFVFSFFITSCWIYFTYNAFLVKQIQKNDLQIHRVCTEWWKKGDKCFFFFFQSDCYFSRTWKSSWRSSSAIIRFFMCSTCSFSDQEKNTWKALIFLHPSPPKPKVIFYWVRLLSLTSHFRPFFVFHVGHAFYNLSLHSFCHSSMSNNRCSSEVKEKNF